MRKELRAINSLSKYEALNKPKEIEPKKTQQEFSIKQVKELQKEISQKTTQREEKTHTGGR